jgi:hypothetical protein
MLVELYRLEEATGVQPKHESTRAYHEDEHID